jgi:hypothetical protein
MHGLLPVIVKVRDFHRRAAAEARERAEFDQAVAARVETKMAIHHVAQHLVAKAHGDTSIPRPRTDSLEPLEAARIKALADARSYATGWHFMSSASRPSGVTQC